MLPPRQEGNELMGFLILAAAFALLACILFVLDQPR